MNTQADWLSWRREFSATEIATAHEPLQSGAITQQAFDALKANALR
ncbi:hypothetical protein [Humibacillus xanthopallidus]